MAAVPDDTRLSPNFNSFPLVSGSKTVIIHATRSGKPNNPTELIGTLNFMSTPGTVSSHWVVGRQGEKVRVVPDNRQAWHASEDNARCWGIEVCQGVESDGFTTPQLAALAEICRGYMADFSVPAVHCGASTTPGFIGHEETAQGKRFGKSDPGNLFDWSAFIASLKGDPVDEAELNELADRRALALVVKEISWPEYGDGLYRPVSVDDDGTFLTIEFWNPDRTRPADPVSIKVRKP